MALHMDIPLKKGDCVTSRRNDETASYNDMMAGMTNKENASLSWNYRLCESSSRLMSKCNRDVPFRSSRPHLVADARFIDALAHSVRRCPDDARLWADASSRLIDLTEASENSSKKRMDRSLLPSASPQHLWFIA
jgi:hypothetical protein